MATASWNKLTFPARLFLWLLLYSLVLTGCFLSFQYHRERSFKAEELNARLQLLNDNILEELAEGKDPARINTHMPQARMTVIAPDGSVMFDTDALTHAENHLSRSEIARARRLGSAYSVRRHSSSTGRNYFYSATRGADGTIVRTALPYDVSLASILAADLGFLWFMGAVTVVMCILGFFASRHLGQRVTREKEHMRKQLTNNINHELKTPVAAIRVCIETLLDHPDLPAGKRTEFLSRCLADSERLSRLMADVSLITRMDDGGHAITVGPIDVGAIIAETAAEQEPRAAARNVAIRCDIDAPLILQGNHSLMASVFSNLIDNAIAYSGGSEIIITLRHSPDRRHALITVADNGCGVAPEHLPRIFERFYRVDKGRSRAAGGTGLGLSIVKNAILFHGGTIAAANRPDGGLLLSITLPVG